MGSRWNADCVAQALTTATVIDLNPRLLLGGPGAIVPPVGKEMAFTGNPSDTSEPGPRGPNTKANSALSFKKLGTVIVRTALGSIHAVDAARKLTGIKRISALVVRVGGWEFNLFHSLERATGSKSVSHDFKEGSHLAHFFRRMIERE